MSKVFTTMIKIAGALDGSLLAALNNATRGLKGLKNAASGRIDLGGSSLSRKLQELRQAQTMLDRLKLSLQTNAGMNGLKKASDDVRRLKVELEQARAAGDKALASTLERQLKSAEKNLASAFKGFRTQTQDIRELESALKAAGLSINNLATAEARLKSAVSAASKAWSEQERLSKAYINQNEASMNLNNAWTNMSNAISTAETIMAPIRASAETAMNYEAELSRSKALTQMDHINQGRKDLVEKEMAMLDARYQEIGRTTQFSATQAAGAGNYLAMAGWDANKINAGLPSVVNLAIASGSGVESAADILSNIQTGFGYGTDAESIQHLADVLTYTVTHSNQNLQQLGDTMKYVAPVAKMFGSSVEETAALTKFMADAGIQGSMAGTSLRATMLRLVAPPKKASKAMLENGITVDDAAKAWVNAQETAAEYNIKLDQNADAGHQMVSIIEQINTKMAGLSTHEKMAAFSAITGINAVSGAMNIFEQDASKITEFTALLEDASKGQGAAAQTAGIMADNTKGALITLESAFESLKIAAGNAFLPTITGALQSLTEVTRSVSAFASANPTLISGFGKIAAAISAGVIGLGAFRLGLAGISFVSTTLELMKATAAFNALGSAGGIIGGLASKFGGLSSVIGVVGRALAALAGPWGVALVAIATMVIANWDKVGSFFENLGSRISRAMSSAFKTASTLYKAFKDGSLFDKDFSIKGYQQKELGREVVKRNTTLEESEKETAVLATRSATREKASGEEIGKAIATSLSALSNQTAARQDEMFRTVAEELKSRKDLTSETVATALSTLRTEMASARVETSAAMMNELERLTRETNKEEFNGRLEDTFASMQASNVAQADRLTSALIAFSERDKATDVTTKLDAITSYVESQTGIKDELKGEIISAFRENMQTDVTARIGEQVSAAIKETSDSKALVDQLTTVMMSQEDRSSASIEMMMTTVQSALEARENSSKAEVEALMSNLQSSVSTAMDEQRTQAAATFESLQASSSDAGAAMTQAGQLAQQLGINAEQAGQMVQILSAGASEAGNAAQAASGGLSGLAGAGNSAASALEGAAARISAIQINVPQVNYVPMSVPIPTGGAVVGGHAEGGIFPHGAHLTWFAEDSAEAAIPIKKGDSNAISLWQRTGAMLGVLGGQQPSLPMSSMSNGYISDEMARKIGTFSNEVRKSKSYESMRRAQRARTFSDEVVDASSKNPSMMKSGGLFGGLFGGISPMMSALPSMTMVNPLNALQSSSEQTSESLSSKLQTYDQLEQQSMSLSTTTNNDQSMPPITLNFHFNGNVNREDVQRGVEESLPSIRETFEQQMAKYRHEVSRRSF